ncbi:MAG: DNA polymerase Y family protein, partial [Bacteroidetes bacterium]|nr:DNA polymerase Y family protein [Bacteroidota bacterium]
MAKRFVSIWFQQLTADWMVRHQPQLKDTDFVLAAPEHGRMIVKAVSNSAQQKGICLGMVVADCRAILPSLQVFDDKPELPEKLLRALAGWCLRYTPAVAIDLPDGLMLDVTGCPHLWGGEIQYLKDILTRLRGFNYHVRAAIADTIGTAWAISRYGLNTPLIIPGMQADALLPLPPAALRLEASTIERLEKLGLYQVENFIDMPRRALRRRFGPSMLLRLDQALGQEIEFIDPIQPIEPYQERLPCLEPIRTATGIEIALQKLLEMLCERLAKENKGLRCCLFKAW